MSARRAIARSRRLPAWPARTQRRLVPAMLAVNCGGVLAMACSGPIERTAAAGVTVVAMLLAMLP